METGGPAPHRLVMAALGAPDGLSRAYRELRTGRFAADQICALGAKGTMAALQQDCLAPGGSLAELKDLVGELAPLAFSPAEPVLGTAGSFLARLKDRDTTRPAGDPARACWLNPEARAGMIECMREGNVWLIVNAASHPQWVQGNRLLLNASRFPIKGLVR